MVNDRQRLETFKTVNNVVTKGPLSLVIQLTRIIKAKSFPLVADDFLTKNKGQVAGLGGGSLKKILKEHGICQILASEGGRTSRGNMGLMIKYVDFLNQWSEERTLDLDYCEEYWADQIREYFRNQPLILTADASKTIGANFEDLFTQARKRQSQNPGTQYMGTILQHLVGAKLLIVLPEGTFDIHGASVADAPTDRNGDFIINKTTIHCTTAPGQPLIEKCQANLRAGYSPVIITIFDRVKTALDLATDASLTGRIEVWDIQQFLASNIYEHSFFDDGLRNSTIADIIKNYNTIIQITETDPSLRIEFEAK